MATYFLKDGELDSLFSGQMYDLYRICGNGIAFPVFFWCKAIHRPWVKGRRSAEGHEQQEAMPTAEPP